MIEKLYEEAYRIVIPFGDIYTTSFLLARDGKCIIADSGKTDRDAQQYILPQVEEMDLVPEFLLISHAHSDHIGGMRTLREAYQNANVLGVTENNLKDGDVLLGRYQVLQLTGHTEDSIGVLDLENHVLFSFDSLQLAGISRYRNGVADKVAYQKTICRLQRLKPNGIIASHAYEPYGYKAMGEEEVRR